MKIDINKIIFEVVQQIKKETFIVSDKLILDCLKTADVQIIDKKLIVIIDTNIINNNKSCICKGFYQPVTCPVHGRNKDDEMVWEYSSSSPKYPKYYKAVGDDYTVKFKSLTTGTVIVKGSSINRDVGDFIGGLNHDDKTLWINVDEQYKRLI